MKKSLKNAAVFLSAMILLSCSGKNGTFTSRSTGFGGEVTVTVSVKDGTITNVKATGEKETAAIGGQAIAEFNSKLFEGIKGSSVDGFSSGKLDSVSGATVTSKAVHTALSDAVKKAEGKANSAKSGKNVKDGTYTASAPSYSVTELMTLDVTFKNNAITDISVKESGSSDTIFETVQNYFIPRVIKSQNLATDVITGATVSSSAVKTIIADAITQAGGNPDAWYKPVKKSNKTKKIEGYDVIVVGLGGAGLTSYLGAAEQGASVFGIEKAAKIGGNSTNTSGPMAINPPSRVASNGGKFVEENELIEDWMEYTDGKAKKEMVSLMVNESGSAFDWLEQNYDFKFGDTLKAFFNPHPWKVWTAYTDKSGKNKDIGYVNSIEAAKKRNPKNTYMLELTAESLITDKSGKVTGVKAKYYDGTTYEIYGKTVILATGGFIGDPEMSTKYLGGVWHTRAVTQNDGAGIKMAQALGAALYNPDVAPVAHIAHLENIIRTEELTKDEKAILTSMVLDTKTLLVDGNGKYFNDQVGRLLAFDSWKAGPNYYAIYTEEQIKNIREKGLAKINVPTFYAQGGNPSANVPVTTLDKILTVAEQKGDAFKASSLAELAKAIGVSSLEEAAAKAGIGKSSCYYAIKGATYVYSSCGGLDIDSQMRVLKTDGSAIENLYAVGTDSIGVLLESKKAYVTYGGAAHGWALTSGRIAGTNAAKQALGK
ncbi:MAG: FAD-binding protein [Treponema sp.]|nr:FAD-binding protein [Treponema sp.]